MNSGAKMRANYSYIGVYMVSLSRSDRLNYLIRRQLRNSNSFGDTL